MAEGMNQIPLFSSGLELANLVVTSDLLHHSWQAILELSSEINPHELPTLPFSVRFRAFPRSNCTIIAFVTSPTCTKLHLQEQGGNLVASSTLKDTFPLFQFLCTKENPSFSIHRAAITLFSSLYNNNTQLSLLRDQFCNSTPLIVTGNSLGGSLASLFTLWLLDSVDLQTTRYPLCITFGSPLVGDSGLQQAILQYSTWNSCFLNVVSDKDQIPQVFMSQSSIYKPFGIYLFCSELGCACFEDHESVLELLAAMGTRGVEDQDPYQGLQILNYGRIVEHLKSEVIFKDTSELSRLITDPFQAEIIAAMEAIGVGQIQQINMDTLTSKMKENIVTRWRKAFDPSKKLNDIKIYMAYLEWYKKTCKDDKIGYYDSYKNQQSPSDQHVVKFKRHLANYWEDMVAEVERKPQKEGATFRMRWLYAGTNYRRMVEPLEIAEFYRHHGQNDHYLKCRPQHYKLLEKWLSKEEKPSTDSNKASIASSLTIDSCFWAHVEEALISCKLLRNGESSIQQKESCRERLIEFEQSVMDSIKNYAVSPEIFLEKSSFMQWWREYEEIIGTSHNSQLTNFMKNGMYKQYAAASLVFTRATI